MKSNEETGEEIDEIKFLKKKKKKERENCKSKWKQ